MLPVVVDEGLGHEQVVHGRPEGHVPLRPVLELDREHESTIFVLQVGPQQQVGVALHKALADELGVQRFQRPEIDPVGEFGDMRRISSSIMRRWEKIFFSAASYTRIPTWGAGVSSGEQGDNKLGRIEGRVHGQMGSSLRTYLKAAREALALVPMRGRSFPHHLIFPSIMSTAWALNTSGSKCSPIHSFM